MLVFESADMGAMAVSVFEDLVPENDWGCFDFSIRVYAVAIECESWYRVADKLFGVSQGLHGQNEFLHRRGSCAC